MLLIIDGIDQADDLATELTRSILTELLPMNIRAIITSGEGYFGKLVKVASGTDVENSGGAGISTGLPMPPMPRGGLPPPPGMDALPPVPGWMGENKVESLLPNELSMAKWILSHVTVCRIVPPTEEQKHEVATHNAGTHPQSTLRSRSPMMNL